MRVTQPASIKVHKTSGSTMEIVWKDGHQATYTFTYLRDACPCALCNDEREKQRRQPDQPSSKPDAPGALPMFKPLLRPTEVAPVGNYAIRFSWNDGHQHGIYSWDYLRTWCPCAECHAARHADDDLNHDIKHHPPSVQ